MKPRIGITMGDPGGIGPEVILKSLCDAEIVRRADLCVIGHEETFFENSKRFGICPIFKEKAAPEAWSWRKVPFLALVGEEGQSVIPPGAATAEGGRLSFQAVEKALELVQGGFLDGFVTAPISKASWNLAGLDFTGHTDYLAQMTGKDAVMMMVGGRLRVALVTVHLPLKQALEALTPDLIWNTIRVTQESLIHNFGFTSPRIGLAGVNPHSGEGGLMGSEEEEIIGPAVERALQEGVQVEGPFPPDVVFRLGAAGKYDAVIAMYHDQGLIPIKILTFDEAVNITLGIPVVRTSPAHGTAFDIAGKGVARPEGLGAAIRQAAAISRRDREGGPGSS
ncbi:MAG: 4-hydroxythreonine-4-phosphate dehydrogenase PdxA [Planctomycetota bacterium]|jgi:4-hydroxythreonine-4-phosphate dehydrogenase